MDTYQYHPLLHPKDIRLVAIQPGEISDPIISCCIIHTRLSERPRFYEALSYTWGDPFDKAHITIMDGNRAFRLDVTRNCYNALLDLRWYDEPRLLWIDVICIDQGNVKERDAQVSLMRIIYKLAYEVVVYLGEETAGSRLIFEELWDLEKDLHAFEPNFVAQKQGNPHQLDMRHRTELDKDLIRELDALVSRPWFERVWVIQEAFHSQRLVMKCGRAQASFVAFRKCVWGYHDTRMTTERAPFILSFAGFAADFKQSHGEHQVAAILWTILGATRALKATDPRDRIFALKGLIPYSAKLEEITTYEKSFEKVSLEVALFLLPAVDLWILLAVRHPHSMSMPSWVPYWSQDTPLHVNLRIGVTPEDENHPQHRSECCGGTSSTVMPTDPNNNASYTGKGFVIRNLEYESSCENVHPVLFIGGTKLSQIVAVSAVFDFQAAKGLTFVSLQHARDLFESKDQLSAEALSSNALIPADILVRLCRTANVTEFFARGGAYGSGHRDWTDPDFMDARGPESGAARWLKEELHKCRIYIDDADGVGIAPSESRVGDVISVLHGAYELCLLRERSQGGWHLISGDLYAHGQARLRLGGPYLTEFAIW